jgi:hypothetical protein
MGTKNNPGLYDCYAKADPDEPLFTLRGKDVSAPYLVDIWTAVRQGQLWAASATLNRMIHDPRVEALIGDCVKFGAANQVAADMRAWRAMLDAQRAE